MQIMKKFLALAPRAALLAAISVSAVAAASADAATTVYDFAGNRTASNPSGAFAYGTATGGSGFTSLTDSYASCFSNASFACRSVLATPFRRLSVPLLFGPRPAEGDT